MFRARYLLSDIARILKRSEVSLMRDAQLGLLRARPVGHSRTRAGSSETYCVTLSNLVRYMGKDAAYATFGKAPPKQAEEAVQPLKPQLEVKYKKCRACGRLKPIAAFPREASATHWLAAECNECSAKARRKP